MLRDTKADNKTGTRQEQGRDMTGMMGTKLAQDKAFRGLKKFSGGWWWSG